METAFGILLFVIVYGAVAYVIYDEVTGKRAGLRRWQPRRAQRRGPAPSGSRATASRSPSPSTRLSTPSR
jgi:hypothetical protein